MRYVDIGSSKLAVTVIAAALLALGMVACGADPTATPTVTPAVAAPAAWAVDWEDTRAAAQQEGARGGAGRTGAERLWSCPERTRLTVVELAEALHRPTSYVYGLTRSGAVPHVKLDGHVVFIVSELRAWLVEREERIVLQKSAPISSRRTA